MVFKLEAVKNKMDDQFVTELFKLLKDRAKINNNSSYTSQLIKNPDLLAKKIGEESTELIIDFIKKNKLGIINESADLLYHIFVVWISMGINPQEIWDELSKRQSQSGIEEKKNRGKNKTDIDVLSWAQKGVENGAGEILLTSMSADGTKKGYNLELTKLISDNVSVPVIASGGAGNPQDMVDVVLHAGASAVLAASIFHFGIFSIPSVKKEMEKNGIQIRGCEK